MPMIMRDLPQTKKPETAEFRIMDVSVMTALRMVRRGIVKGRQYVWARPGRSKPRMSLHTVREMSRSAR